MKAKRWTLGVVLAAAVSLFGLIQADASPFSTYLLSDDLGNVVNGTPPKDPATLGYNVNGDSGHGNNEDGVDSSNEGTASHEALGGDDSCPDPDNCVDDESSGGGAAPSKGRGPTK